VHNGLEINAFMKKSCKNINIVSYINEYNKKNFKGESIRMMEGKHSF
jgi:hypothetical protein